MSMGIDLKIDVKELYNLLDDNGKKILYEYLKTKADVTPIVKQVLGIQ